MAVNREVLQAMLRREKLPRQEFRTLTDLEKLPIRPQFPSL